jgi:tetratricopeptide (TPR) repeat protein
MRLKPLALIALFTTVTSFSQVTIPDAKLHNLVLQGIDLTWKEQYVSADSVFACVVREFPKHPSGFLYQAGVELARAMDNEEVVNVQKFDSLIAAGRLRAELAVESGSDRMWGCFFVGTADGSDSYARVYRGDWFGGTRKGFSSVSAFKDAVKLDSSLADAYAGIGAFYYWRSRKTESFNWLPFVGDDRAEALPLLMRTVERGIYNRYTALNMLVAIYMDAKKYDKAITCSVEGLKRYPKNRAFLWGLATASQKAHLWTDAAMAYQRLLSAIVVSQDNNHYNEVVCMLNLAKVELELGKTSDSKSFLSRILQFHESDFPLHLQTRAKEKLEHARTLFATVERSGPPVRR